MFKTDQKHPAFAEEQKQLQTTLNWIKGKIEERSRWEDQIYQNARLASVSYMQENSQEDIELDLNKQLYKSALEKLNRLKHALNQPYFARIDFLEDGESQVLREIYIGRNSLIEDGDSPVVIDWRSPVANLYYDCRLGLAAYSAPDGQISGCLKLKRQLNIVHGELQRVIDIDVTADDELLRDYLGVNTDNRLRDIVATIQAEQNQVIRADIARNLIIQGAAGSGKTTVALHRLAYLIYQYPALREEDFMIIAPHKLFLDYISAVLPGLGTEKIQQTTFVELAQELIGETLNILDYQQKLANIINQSANGIEPQVIQKISGIKSSRLFRIVIDRYLRVIEKSVLPETAFGYDGIDITAYKELHRIYHEDYRDWPFYQRVEQLKKHLRQRLTSFKVDYPEQLEQQCAQAIAQVKQAMPEESESRRLFITQLIEEKESKIQRMHLFAKRGIQDYLNKMKQPRLLGIYQELFAEEERFLELTHGIMDDETARSLKHIVLGNLKAGWVDYDDLAPLLYLQMYVFGWEKEQTIRHLVIDEAQDYSVFQYITLKKIFKKATFTILGDVSQGIYHYQGITDWERLLVEVFSKEHDKLAVLNQSYRTTIEIMTAANRLSGKLNVPGDYQGVSIIRHGKEVEIISKQSQSAIAGDIAMRIGLMAAEEFKSIAVICKTLPEAEVYLKLLKEYRIGVTLITGKETTYAGGLMVIPSYLVKGLEFDAVIIADAGKDCYDQDNVIDARLLYIAMTRPLHRLLIYYQNELTGLLGKH